MTFAVITNASSGHKSFFQGGYAGILGLAYAGISEGFRECGSAKSKIQAVPFMDALVANNVVKHDIFTISFCGETVSC